MCQNFLNVKKNACYLGRQVTFLLNVCGLYIQQDKTVASQLSDLCKH